MVREEMAWLSKLTVILLIRCNAGNRENFEEKSVWFCLFISYQNFYPCSTNVSGKIYPALSSIWTQRAENYEIHLWLK